MLQGSKQQGREEETVVNVRTLYRSLKIPTLLLLLCTALAVWILRDSVEFSLLSAWAIFITILIGLRIVFAYLFERATAQQQVARFWRLLLRLDACLSGLAVAIFASVFIPQVEFEQQVLLLGLSSLVIASTCIAYALSSVLFACYAITTFVPTIWAYFQAESKLLHGFGLLTVMFCMAMMAAAYQVNRLLWKNIQQRVKKQLLIATLQQAKADADDLNIQLSAEIGKKEAVQDQLLRVQDRLQEGVNARTAELQETLQALEKSQARLELALDASQLALWDWDLVSDQTHHTHVENIFGIASEQVNSILSDLRPLLHPDDLPVLRSAMIEHMQQRSDGYAVEYRIKHHDGHWVWIEDRGRAVERDSDGRVLRMLGTRRDISARKQRDEELRLASSVFDAGTEGIIILDPKYKILTVNKAFTAVTGYTRDEVLNKNIFSRALPDSLLRQYQRISLSIEQQGSWQGEVLDRRKNGETYPQRLQIHVVRDKYAQITHIVGFFSDLTDRRQAEERLTYLTQYDELTGLANRALFHQRLQQGVERARETGERMALLHIDLDRFKVLNESLGIEVADQVLKQISQRLTQLLPDANTLARLGGNEFAIILDNCSAKAVVSRLCRAILARICLPVEAAGNELIISASLGVSLLPDNAREPASLITQAHMALQQAKHLGSNNFQFYNDQLQASTLERLQLELQLRRGIEEGQLQAYYQPKLTLADGVIRSAEALVRWHHPQRGLVPPAEFIALAEETGLIGVISELVLLQACEQALLWLQQGMPVRVSVNLSVGHVRQGNLASLVQDILQKTGLPAYLLELELTESQLLENAESMIDTLKQLREMGVYLAIDDFGTGYSSLSYLKRLPANSVKIDKSFIRDIVENSEDAAITRAIITMVHGLNLVVVAEGVETQAQKDFLQANQCDEVQGYLISRPLPPEQFNQFLMAQHKP